MKALRYLLIVVMLSVASMLFATAQNLAQQPQAEMKSTSGMMYSGSTLPSAAATGTVTTGSKLGTYSPASTACGPRRAKKDENPGGGFNPGGDDNDNDRDEPWADPIGDAGWPLAMLAAAYALLRLWRKRSV